MGKRQKPKKTKTKKKRRGTSAIALKSGSGCETATKKVSQLGRDSEATVSKHTPVRDRTLLSVLRQRLRTKKKLFRTAREGGSRQEVQQILRNFNGDDEEKLRMMREVKDEVTGLRQKDAKRYLRRAVSGMSSTQSEGFMDMVQSKLPSQHRKQIQTYVKAHQKEQGAKESARPKVNPETVYVPQHMKASSMSNPSTVPKTSTIPKKKKVFKALNVHVPKLSEVSGFNRDQDDTSGRKKTQSNSTPALDLSYDRRMQRLASFSREWASQKLQEAMWHVSDSSQLEKVTSLQFGLDIPRALPIPGTEIVPQSLPIELRNLVREAQQDTALGPYVYRDIEGVTWRYDNAYAECVKFKERFEPVMAWLRSIMGTWTVASEVKEILRGMGIVSAQDESNVDLKSSLSLTPVGDNFVDNSSVDNRQKEDTTQLMLMCKKYRNDKTGHETVPIVPWAQIIFSKTR